MASEQQLSKVSYNADVSKVPFAITWQVASATLKRFGVGINPPTKLDEDALAKMMVKNKKELVFVARLVDQKTVKVLAVCGSESKEILTKPLDTSKNDVWIKDMTALKGNSSLVSDAELKEFVKKHPDPAVINGLKSELTTLQGELKTIAAQLKAKNAEVEAKKKAIVEAGGKL